MKLLIKLGWRNIWRNKRRSIITIAAVSFAVLASVSTRGLQLGTYKTNINTAVRMLTGYLQVQREGYQKNPSLQRSFAFNSPLKQLLEEDPGVESFAPRIYADGLVSFKENSTGALLLGMDPAREREVTTFMEKVHEGRFFDSDTTNEVVVGRTLLENLNAQIGDDIVILSQGYDGSLGNMKFRIVGTAKTGSKEFDAMSVFMGLTTAQELVAMWGRINIIAVAATSLDEIDHIQTRLAPSLAESSLVILTWGEVMPDFKQSIEFDNVGGVLFLGILVVVVGFGILNTVLLSVLERFREFGVTLSIGMPQSKLVILVFVETFFITLIGLMIGSLIGGCINWYVVQNPIMLSGKFGELYAEYGFLPRLDSTLDPGIFININLTILLVSLIACLYPAYRVFKLEPLKGIRYT